MKQTVTEHMFWDAFKQIPERKDTFSYHALKALYEYLDDPYAGDYEYEFDMVALCCEWSEYDTALEYAVEFFEFEGMTYDDEHGGELETPEEVEEKALKFLKERTQVIEVSGEELIEGEWSPVSSILVVNF